MTCAPSLLKFLGIKLSLEITKPKAFAEQRLFQAILVQALEDATNVSGFKKETYHKHDSHKWFINNSEDFKDVCWGADMDPEFVRGEYLKLINVGKIHFTKLQKSWISYRDLYKRYRAASTKEERRIIKKLILKENLKRLEN
jgi:hypothetical protein|tara:strand:+ start:141 stop:566 length:426 start_codon:yes stop_codon:yes gene_type:complete